MQTITYIILAILSIPAFFIIRGKFRQANYYRALHKKVRLELDQKIGELERERTGHRLLKKDHGQLIKEFDYYKTTTIETRENLEFENKILIAQNMALKATNKQLIEGAGIRLISERNPLNVEVMG